MTPKLDRALRIAEKRGHVKVENGMAAIYVPANEIHGLLVALQPCPRKWPKSKATRQVALYWSTHCRRFVHLLHAGRGCAWSLPRSVYLLRAGSRLGGAGR